MEEDVYYPGDMPDLGDIDEDLLRAYLNGEVMNPELDELLKGAVFVWFFSFFFYMYVIK